MIENKKYIEAGKPFKIYSRRGMKDACVIGVCGDDALIEFSVVSVGGIFSYTALRIVNVYDDPTRKSIKPRKNVRYTDDWSAPTRFAFIENAALNNRNWTGNPRNYSRDIVPTVQEAYMAAKNVYHRKYVKKVKV